MATNFDSINGDENLDNPLERKITTIEQAVALISQIIEQLKLSNSLKGFELIRENRLTNAFRSTQKNELQVLIDSSKNQQWMMFLDKETQLNVSGFDSNLKLDLKRRAIGHDIGNLTIEDSESEFIRNGKLTQEDFCSIVVDLVNKFSVE
jgi:hypothetical protein